MMTRATFLVIAALVVGGCAGGERAEPLIDNDDPSLNLGRRLGALPPRDSLEKGECAMFLWRRGGSRQRLVLHVTEEENHAVVALDGAARKAERTSVEGLPVFGQYRKQTFAYEDLSLDLSVRVEERASLIGGAIVPGGVLRLTDAEGWSASFPVAGIIGCGG